ncbi:hypothetical protein THAOC_02554 [Thalassiosira oceanica]|uniref:Gamma-glutamylcyclotransferase AIG2-like domain-containing protein n=1 Tax=Thalassiosira oceanica TaxID=159749 RepID=K0TLY6_THAOC|nr:hypothetical protein THAOC_02554 [Thalassiosira oceanica]|eukprot:EJK75711.1 hypothetical protein THAOC_02554 [Thalassiosira oceanica]
MLRAIAVRISAASLALGFASSSVALSEALVRPITLSKTTIIGTRRQCRREHVSAASPSRPSTSLRATAADTMSSPSNGGDRRDAKVDEITILGFGSLLSHKSARLTFPTLKNFRLGRVPDHRRVFAHPASIFFQRGIADMETLEMSSLSCEYVEGASFVCSVFEVPNEGLSATGATSGDDNWVPSRAFLEREEEFEIAMVPYEELTSADVDGGDAEHGIRGPRTREGTSTTISEGATRAATTAATKDRFKRHYADYGVETIWGWDQGSGLRPCAAYLRHCVLASWNCGDGTGGGGDAWSADGAGGLCYGSFLDETFLVDRETTVREYLRRFPDVMATEPPEGLRERCFLQLPGSSAS